MDDLLDTLAHGDDAAVTARIYDVEHLSDAARRIPLGLLRRLHAPEPHWKLEVLEQHKADPFKLFVLRIPWLVKAGELGSGLHPLIVAPQGDSLRAVGFMLPWNEIIPRLGTEMKKIGPLSMTWIGRITAAKAAN